MRNVIFETLLDPFLKLNSSITHKDEHFAKKNKKTNALKLDENLKSSIFLIPPFKSKMAIVYI
jgi:hypothetical protein